MNDSCEYEIVRKLPQLFAGFNGIINQYKIYYDRNNAKGLHKTIFHIGCKKKCHNEGIKNEQ